MGESMRSSFPGYYRPTKEEFDQLWKDCIFVFDASMLLRIYGYTAETQGRFLDVLTRLKGMQRVWLPHQAAYEFHDNRLKVIHDQHRALKDTSDLLVKILSQVENHLGGIQPHSFIAAQSVMMPLQNAVKKITSDLKKKTPIESATFDVDPLLDRLTSIFDGEVGKPYDDAKLQAIYKEGKERYDHDVPPGFRDKQKPGNEKYGDLVLWHQILDYGQAQKKPVILVIDDVKDDWKWEYDKKKIGPRPELIQEMYAKANVRFYTYESEAFIEYAQEMLQLVDKQAARAVEEARRTTKQHEKSLTSRDKANDILRSAYGLNAANMLAASQAYQQILANMPKLSDIENFLLPSKSLQDTILAMLKQQDNVQQMLSGMSGHTFGVLSNETEDANPIIDLTDGEQIEEDGKGDEG